MAIYSEFSHEKMLMFHSYVSLPEGRHFHMSTVLDFGQTTGFESTGFTAVMGSQKTGGSVNGGTPKWMVYFMEKFQSKMDDLRVPLF